jgi:hypothetical protein
VSLRMLTILRLADLRLTTARQRSTGQNLPSDLYVCFQIPFNKFHLVSLSQYVLNIAANKLHVFNFPSRKATDQRNLSANVSSTVVFLG